ncbi:MAG: 50S ribosomal protein L10 [Actinomycetota bacterium]
MARSRKVTSVAEIADHFRESSAAVLTEYRGLTVAQLKELRRTLGDTVTYAVVKNTLTKRAARDAGVTGLDGLLAGPSAIAFVKGDPVDAAKGIRKFAKENPALVIKGGFMDGAFLSAAQIVKIADLESREVLLSKLAGAMQAKQARAAGLLAAPLGKAARALGALQVKLEAGAPAAPAPAPAAEAAPAPVEEPTDSTADAVAETEEVTTPADAEASAEETTEG